MLQYAGRAAGRAAGGGRAGTGRPAGHHLPPGMCAMGVMCVVVYPRVALSQSFPCGTLQAPAVVEIMKRDHHNFALKKMGESMGCVPG